MILTAETFKEKEQFFELFDDYVDDVSVKAYTERGGSLDDLGSDDRNSLISYLHEKELLREMPISGQVSRAKGRESTNQTAFPTTRRNMEPRHIPSKPLKQFPG